MTKTYSQIQKQIETLSREAEKLRQKEVEGVVSRIREAIDTYGLTAADLGFDKSGAARTPRAARKSAAKKTRGSRKAAAAAQPKYRDEAGNVWGGRGPRPQWLRNALGAGKELKDFAV